MVPLQSIEIDNDTSWVVELSTIATIVTTHQGGGRRRFPPSGDNEPSWVVDNRPIRDIMTICVTHVSSQFSIVIKNFKQT